MAYDPSLAESVRNHLASRENLVEKKMFGGIAFMLSGNMCCGILGSDLMVRVGPDNYEQSLARPHARKMDVTGRPMKGFVAVSPEGTASEDDLSNWVDQGVRYALSLPPK